MDVRDLGGHLDTTFHGWSSTLASRVRLVVSRLVLVSALPLDFHGRLRVLRSMFIPGALHGIEASFLAGASLRKLRTAFVIVAWSRRQSFASVGAVLSLLDGPSGCDPAFCVVWFRFRMLRRYLAYHPGEVFRVYRLLERSAGGCPGHGPVHLLLQSASAIWFHWDFLELAWRRPGLPLLSNLSVPFQHFRAAILGAWRDAVSAELCTRKGFRGGPLFDIDGTLQLLNSDHVRERDKALLRSILVGSVWNGFFLERYVVRMCLVGFAGVVTLMVIFFGIVLFHLLLRSVNILSFMILWRWIRLLGLGAFFGMVGYLFSLELMVVLLGLTPLLRALLTFWSVRLGGILLVSLLSGSYLLILMSMVLLLGLRMILMFGLMVVWLMIEVPGVSSAGASCFTFGDRRLWSCWSWGHWDDDVRDGSVVSACRGFCSVPGPLQTVQRAELWGVILALQASDGVHLGVDNLELFVMSVGFWMVSFLPVVLSFYRMVIFFFLFIGCSHTWLGFVRISKVKGHADEALVRIGTVRGLDKLGNDGADEAADFGRRRVPWWVIDARRNLSGVCSRWRPLVLVLHRFFIAISRAVVNHDDGAGTALDPLVWSAGSAPKRRRVAVRNRAFFTWTA